MSGSFRAVMLPRYFLGAVLAAATLSGAAQANACYTPYTNIAAEINAHKGYQSLILETDDTKRRGWENRLESCLNGKNDSDSKGITLFLLGRIEAAQGSKQKKVEAINHFRSALKTRFWDKKKLRDIEERIGRLLRRVGHHKEYIRHANMMAYNYRDIADGDDVWRNIATSYLALGDVDLAISNYKKAIERGTLKGHKSQNADMINRLVRAKGRSGSCKTVDSGNLKAENLLRDVEDCLASPYLPMVDRAKAHYLRGEYYIREAKDTAKASADFKRLWNMPVDPPVFITLDKDHIFYRDLMAPMVIIANHVATGDIASAKSVMNKAATGYENHQRKINEIETGYRADFRRSSDSSYLKEWVRLRFLSPMVDLLRQHKHFKAAAALISEELGKNYARQETVFRLRVLRAELRAQAGDPELAISEFSVLLAEIEESPTGAAVLQKRHIFEKRASVNISQGKYKLALEDFDLYFAALPANWWQLRQAGSLEAVITLAAQTALQAKDRKRAETYITHLENIYKANNKPCSNCTKLRSFMDANL